MADYAADEVGVADDWPTGFAQVPDWITLHPELKAQSVREYAFLAMHAPKDGRRRVAFPGQASIARALQLGRSDKVTPYTRALEKAGAVRIEEIATPKGRAYRYVLRFNPPIGYTGPTSLSDFYGTREDDVDGRWAEWSMATAQTRPAGQEGSPQKEGHPSPQKAGDPYPQKEGSNQTSTNHTSLNQNDTAPSARSAGDARRASAGSSACDARGGSAAAGKTRPSKVKLTREQAAAVAMIEDALPEGLVEELRDKRLMDRHLPTSVQQAIVKQLVGRTPDQLADRMGRRWARHGYAKALRDGEGLARPLGVVHALLRAGECPDLGCEDGVMLDTGVACRACEGRKDSHRRGERAPSSMPQQRGPEPTWTCTGCYTDRYTAPPETLQCWKCAAQTRAAFELLAASLQTDALRVDAPTAYAADEAPWDDEEPPTPDGYDTAPYEDEQAPEPAPHEITEEANH